MSILTDLQPHSVAGLKLSKTLMKAAIRAKATPAVAVVAVLEMLSAACSQTQTYLPKFLSDIAAEFDVVMKAQNQAALDAANPDLKEIPDAPII